MAQLRKQDCSTRKVQVPSSVEGWKERKEGMQVEVDFHLFSRLHIRRIYISREYVLKINILEKHGM